MAINSFSVLIAVFLLLILLGILQYIRLHNDRLERGISVVQRMVMLLFSYWCIYRLDVRFLIVIIGYTIIVYVIGRLLSNERTKTIRLTIGIVVSVIMLGYFKYANFFLNHLGELMGATLRVEHIILPIGISFYTFSGIAYLVDVYRGDYLPEKNILNVALYIAFFPKLTAGPIVRGNVFLPQLKCYNGIAADDVLIGIQIFAFGLFKKIVLADHLCVFVDDVFYAPMAYNTGTVILAVVSYSLQIYFDFSGYSDMAIGLSRMLGFKFDRNFNLPYIATNISDFWKRWHISLLSWFLDYLYIPLGGSRKGEGRKYVNLMTVMLVSGLWHGAGATFIIWGACHGIVSCISNWLGKRRAPYAGCDGSVMHGVKTCVTYMVVALLLVVFRADSMSNAVAVYRSMFTMHSGISQPYTWAFFAIECLLIGTWAARYRGHINRMECVEGFYPIVNLRTVWGLTIFFVFCGLTVLMGYFGNTVFIYGKF